LARESRRPLLTERHHGLGVVELRLDHLRVAASVAADVQTSRKLAAPRSAAAVLFARERTAT
jgi:hypothetical protein